MQDDVAPTPQGLLRCMQFLAEEAADLALIRTLQAINIAIETCRRETLTLRTSEPSAGRVTSLH